MNPLRGSVQVDGIRIYYSFAGTGPDTVLLHGGGPGCTSVCDFAQAYPEMAKERRLILIDLPQFGLSDAPPISGSAWSFHARCVWQVLDQLGVGCIDIVGQSLGGSVAFVMGLDQPDRVRRIVATSSQPIQHSSSVSGIGQRMRIEYYGGAGPSIEKMYALIAELEWHEPASIPSEVVEQRFVDSTRLHARSTWTDPEARGAVSDLSDRLGDLDVPVLVVMGRFDPFAPPEYGMALADRMAHADLLVMSRTSHHPQQERPLDFAHAVLAFLH